MSYSKEDFVIDAKSILDDEKVDSLLNDIEAIRSQPSNTPATPIEEEFEEVNEVDFIKSSHLKGGETWIGTLKSVAKGGEHRTNIYYIEDDDGNKVGIFGSSSLDKKMTSIKLEERIRVKFNGMANGSNGRQYADWSVGRPKV